MGVHLSGQINRCQQAVTSVNICHYTVAMHYLHDYMYLEQGDSASLAIMYIWTFLGISTGSVGLIKNCWIHGSRSISYSICSHRLPITALLLDGHSSHYSIQ